MKEALLRMDLRDECLGRFKHERLKAHLVNEMVAGRLKPGQALPSENEFAEKLGITRVTIRQAMASLENDGLVRRVRGKGNFVEADARRRLKRGQDIFAMVVPETRTGFYPSLLHGFDDAAHALQHQTIISNSDNDVARQAEIVLQLIDKEVGGVAIVPTTEPATPAYQVRQLQKHGIPVVCCHRSVEGVAAPLLSIPFRDVGRLAGKVLAEHKHRHVAFFATHRSRAASASEEGLREVLAACDGNVPVESVFLGESAFLPEQAVFAALQQVFAGSDPPTAIFASFDTLAETIYLLLPRLGLRVPEDVSLLGFGGSWREGSITRRLTSAVIDEAGTGQKAVSLLHEMRRGDRPIDNNEEFVMPVSLSDGETLAMAAAKKQKVS